LTGLISGTPATNGAYPVTVNATNANGSGSATLSFLVGLKPTLITSMPSTATAGSILDIRGQGFTNASAVYFADWRDDLISATLSVTSDDLLRVTVPNTTYSFFDGKSRILIVTPAGATVTVPPDYLSVTGTVTPSAGPFYMVQAGGSLAGGGTGGVKAYVRSGGAASTGGGGGHTYFAEAGATLEFPSGGGHRVICEAGTNVIGSPTTKQIVPSLRPSIVPLLSVLPVPGITSNRTAQARLGIPFIYTSTATNSPTSFAAQGLPPGLSINPGNGIISGRPRGADKVYEVTLTASNSSGTGSATLLLTVLDDYKEWRIASFAALLGGADNPIAQDLADADFDGLCNLLEFSAGQDPLKGNSGSLVAIPGTSPHQFRYRRLRGNGTGTTPDGYTLGTITYTLYVSSDLSAWNTGSAYISEVGTPVDNGDGTETVIFQATGNGTFARLEVRRNVE
jgi:hypothetical protein